MRRYVQFTSNTNPPPPEVLEKFEKMEELSAIIGQGADRKGFYIIYYRCLTPDRIAEVTEAMSPWGTAIECTGEEVSDHRLSLR